MDRFKCWFAAAWFVVALPVAAQVTPPEEYAKTVRTAEVVGAIGTDLFGEEVSLYTGATTFSATDVSLRGNNALPVSIGRRFVVQSRSPAERNDLLARDGGFADWELDIPHLHGVFAKNKGWQVDAPTTEGRNARCSLTLANSGEAPEVQGIPHGGWEGFRYWNGNAMYVPGVGDQELLLVDAAANPYLPSDGKQYRWVTGNQWYVSCLPQTANGVPGEAFLAVAPDGTRYRFDWVVTRFAPTITRNVAAAGTFAPNSPTASALAREEVRILPTLMTDRFGNSVTYTYDAANPHHLTSITSNDGRALAIAWSNNRIAAVSDGTRTWSYVYGDGLTEVVRPDRSRWTIAFANLRGAYTKPGGNAGITCSFQAAAAQPDTYVGTITHPSGAVGTFGFRSQMHGRSYVAKSCPGDPGSGVEGYTAMNPFYFEVVGLTTKTITGPGLEPMHWTYTFGPMHRSWAEHCANNSCADTKTLEVVGPGDYRRYTFGNRWRVSEGKLISTEIGTNAHAILRREDTLYQLDPTGQAYPAAVGRAVYPRSDAMSTRHAPVFKRVVTQQGRTFNWEVARACGSDGATACFDVFARPTRVIRFSKGENE